MQLHRIRSRFFALLLATGGMVYLQAGAAAAGTCADLKNAKAFFDAVRGRVHKAISDDQLQSYKCLFAYWKQLNLDDKRWLSYAMATGWHEARMAPLREGGGSHAKAVAAAKWAYTKGLTKRAYHLPDPATGKIYYGRGLVQLTWASNYQRMGEALGMGDALYRNPDLVLQPDIATKVMMQGMIQGKFCSENNSSIIKRCTGLARSSTPSRLSIYFNTKCAEWYRARRMINGDLAKTANNIAGYAKSYLSGMGTMPIPVSVGAGDVITTEAPPPEEEFVPPTDEGGIAPLTADTPVTPADTGVTVPRTDENSGMGGTPAGSGAAAGAPAAAAPEIIAADKPVVPTEEAIAPLQAPDVEQPAAPAATGSEPAAGAGNAPAAGAAQAAATPPAAPAASAPASATSATTETASGTVGAAPTTPAPAPAVTTPAPATSTTSAAAGMTATTGSGVPTAASPKPADEIKVAQLAPADAAITAADLAAIDALQAALDAQKATVDGLKGSLTAQKTDIDGVKASLAAQQKSVDDARAAAEGAKKAAGDNQVAIDTVAKSVEANRGQLDQISQRLQQMGDAIAALTKEVAELKTPPAKAPDAGGSGEQGWLGKIKGYIWKSN
jgi:hypothetical protein